MTNLTGPPERVTLSCNRRDTVTQWITEGKAAVRWNRLPGKSMTANAARLQLHALACSLSNFMHPPWRRMGRTGRADR
ncbi:MAG: transposase [Rhodospirillales bacterium]|nr:transposase [Rhodospirillales bacterium]